MFLSYVMTLRRVNTNQTLLKSPTSVVLIRDSEADSTAVSVFDFSDLNTYLLTVVGLATPDSQHLAASKSIMDKAQSGKQVLLREIQPLCNSGPLITLDSECKLGQAVELLGSGIHRLLVTGKSGEAIGVMSQLRVLDFFWNEGVNFANIDSLYPMALRELATGTQHPISIKYVLNPRFHAARTNVCTVLMSRYVRLLAS